MDHNQIRTQVIEIIVNILDLNKKEEENLRLEAGYKAIKKWTSARHAEIIVAIEDEYEIEIDELSIAGLNNVKKIVVYIMENK
jgi:acyl carrier protein